MMVLRKGGENIMHWKLALFVLQIIVDSNRYTIQL